MVMKRSALGRGLDALITMDDLKTGGSSSINEIELSKIQPNPEQPRSVFEQEALDELAASIRTLGVIQPITLKEIESDKYMIISGERRYRASLAAGLTSIPAYIRTAEDDNVVEMALIENIQREDLNPIEEALAYKRLLSEFNLKQDEVAERVSKSRTAVTNAMRLLKLNEKVQQMVIDEMLTTGHARALLGIEDQEKQYTVAQKIFDEKLSVRDTEKLVKSLQNEKKKQTDVRTQIDPKLEAIYQDLEEQMKVILGTKVSINHKDSEKGKLEIEYYSQDELDRIIDLLRTIQK